MRLVVTRDRFTPFTTIGKMSVDGEFQYYTLEPAKREDGVKPRAIPCGTYDVKVYWSNKFARLMPHICDVPGFEAIEIHWGNFSKSTEGCTCVGMTRGPMPDFIGESVKAFTDLFLRISEAKDDITITYQEEAHV